MRERVNFPLLFIWMCCSVSLAGTLRGKIFNAPCTTKQFRCLNDVCINRNMWCNNVDDCGDNSDENYCSYSGICPTAYPFYKCSSQSRCIPDIWKCNGIHDCSYDESGCGDLPPPAPSQEESVKLTHSYVNFARKKAVRWIRDQARNETSANRWGANVHKIAVALYLADPTFVSSNSTRIELSYEVSIQLLSKLVLRKLTEVSTSELSSHINALLVTCLDPRKFHSVNLVRELRFRVNAQNYTTPYDILTLCNAGVKITRKDVDKLTMAFWTDRREIWTETQAFAVMALACAGYQSGSHFRLSKIKDFTMELTQKQYRNGTVENMQATALVMQALFSSGPEEGNDFDEEKALIQILSEQREDGSFGNLVNTYYALPLLNYKSLVNISTEHCETYTKVEEQGLRDLMDRPGPKIRVRYSLWIGDEKDFERMLKLRVPANTSFYGIMETAGDIDVRFRFQYTVKKEKPYVNAVSGIQDDAESGKFWFPYIFNGTRHDPVTVSPAEFIPRDNDHIVMWYRKGLWIE